ADRLRGMLAASGMVSTDVPDEQTRTALLLLGESSAWTEVCDFLAYCKQQDLHTICIGLYNRPLEHHKIWELLHSGAEEVLQWNLLPEPDQILKARLKRWTDVDNLLETAVVKEQLIGSSPSWRKLLRQVVEIAVYSSAPVLLLGESGTGKELLARLIHQLDGRANKRDLVVLDCTTVSPELSGSEFFGHEKGAFTNAVANRDGAFALADGGTLFLDEIGELPLPLQAELLRAVQEKMYKRVGSNFWRHTNFRLVSATNRDLSAEVRRGGFREDLFFRLSACVCHVPPLRERIDDVPVLAAYFLKQALGLDRVATFDEHLLTYLRTRPYPGNVRELQQLVARIAYRHIGRGPVTVGELPEQDRPDVERLQNPWNISEFESALRIAIANGIGLKEIKRCVSNKAMELAILEADGNLQDAAYRLQVSDRTIQLYLAAVREGRVPGEVGE
ncbi:MAG: sigma 54-interacting transcriptional regulator, partial [Saprospiraceae bacterium]